MTPGGADLTDDAPAGSRAGEVTKPVGATRFGSPAALTRVLRGSGAAETNAVPAPLRHVVLIGILLVQFLCTSSSTIVATSAPAIADDLHGLRLFAWLFTGYLLAYTITVPLVGKLSDLYGRRPFMLGGLALFAVGSALSGFAPTMTTLVAARVLAGFGGGAIMSLTAAMIGDIFSPLDRARWMALLTGVYGGASIIGPSIGGVLTDHVGWRWIFLANLPIAVVAFFLLAVSLPTLRPSGRRTVDWLGMGLLGAGLTPLLLAVTWGGVTFPWASAPVVAGLVSGIVLLVVFIAHEARAEEPLLGPDLFRNRLFTITIVVQSVIGLGLLGSLTFIPLYFEGVRGQTAQSAGLVLAPLMVGFLGGSFASGQATSATGRWKLQVIGGMAILAVGLAGMSLLTADTQSWIVVCIGFVPGVGLGIAMPVTGTAVLSAFPYRMLGTVNSARQFFNNLGSLVGVAVLTTVILNRFQAELQLRLPVGSPGAILTSGSGRGLLSGEAQAGIASRLPAGADVASILGAVHQALALGIGRAFLIGAILAALAALAGLLLPEIALRRTIEDEAVALEVP